MKSLVYPLTPEFEFAGFTFPKWVWNLPKGSLAKRLKAAQNPCCGGYYHAPKAHRTDRGVAFYLEEKCGPFVLRWKWADEVARIGHTGWWCDEYQSEKIRGLVMRLPHGRGFLAGWSMGEQMASAVGAHIYENEREAAFAADSEAEQVAEREREAEEARRAAEAKEELESAPA